jgi:hypothetical protein
MADPVNHLELDDGYFLWCPLEGPRDVHGDPVGVAFAVPRTRDPLASADAVVAEVGPEAWGYLHVVVGLGHSRAVARCPAHPDDRERSRLFKDLELKSPGGWDRYEVVS